MWFFGALTIAGPSGTENLSKYTAVLLSHLSYLLAKSEYNTEDVSNIFHSHCNFFPNTSSYFKQQHSCLVAILASCLFLNTHNSGQQLPTLLVNSFDGWTNSKDCKISSKPLTVSRAYPYSCDGPHSLSSHATPYHTDKDCPNGIPPADILVACFFVPLQVSPLL